MKPNAPDYVPERLEGLWWDITKGMEIRFLAMIHDDAEQFIERPVTTGEPFGSPGRTRFSSIGGFTVMDKEKHGVIHEV